MASCIEKYEIEHPESELDFITHNYCPHDFGYTTEESDKEACNNYTCEKCWDREVETDMVTELRKKFDIPEPYKFKYTDEMREVLNSNKVVFEPIIAVDKDGKPKITEVSLVHKDNDSSKPRILDSGNRREFESGAVRDIQEGKGRCDLLPLDVVHDFLTKLHIGDEISIWFELGMFKTSGKTEYLYGVLETFTKKHYNNEFTTMLLELAIHFEEGAKKYGDNNWRKGIPVRCYIDSAVRHYLKFLRGDKDEPHDRAFCWNIICAIWTCEHKPELNDYANQTL